MIYAAVLFIHSWLRWIVIFTGVAAVVRSSAGAAAGKPWTATDDRSGFWFSIALDVQFLLGLILYVFLSPFTHAAFADFGGAMKNSVQRFWAIEHFVGMLIAIGLVHMGRTTARKSDTLRRHKVTAGFFVIALVVILASIPWPGLPYGRPLLRW